MGNKEKDFYDVESMRVSNPQWLAEGLQMPIHASTELGAPKETRISRDGGTPVSAIPESHNWSGVSLLVLAGQLDPVFEF